MPSTNSTLLLPNEYPKVVLSRKENLEILSERKSEQQHINVELFRSPNKFCGSVLATKSSNTGNCIQWNKMNHSCNKENIGVLCKRTVRSANNPTVLLHHIEDENVDVFKGWKSRKEPNYQCDEGEMLPTNEVNSSLQDDQIESETFPAEKDLINQCKELSVLLYDVVKRKKSYFAYMNMRLKNGEMTDYFPNAL